MTRYNLIAGAVVSDPARQADLDQVHRDPIVLGVLAAAPSAPARRQMYEGMRTDQDLQADTAPGRQ
jgi:hypothetical protein